MHSLFVKLIRSMVTYDKTFVSEPFFDELAQRYAPKARYPNRIIDRAIGRMLTHFNDNHVEILDLGCGEGYPTERLLARRPALRMTLLDKSQGMLSAAGARLTKAGRHIRLMQGDLNNLQLAPQLFDVIWSCSSIHFARDPLSVFHSLQAILRPHGLLVVIFVARDDLKLQVFHQLFPAFHDIDFKRHFSADELAATAVKSGFQVLRRETFPFQLRFRTRISLVRFVKSKPFSAFALMKENVFKKGFKSFTAKALSSLPKNNIRSSGRITLLIARKLR